MLYLPEWVSSKSLQITNVGEDVDKRVPMYHMGGEVNWCSHYIFNTQDRLWYSCSKLFTGSFQYENSLKN